MADKQPIIEFATMVTRTLKIVLLLICLWALPVQSSGQSHESDSSKMVSVSYGSKGFQFLTRDNRFLLQIQSRLQFRFATPSDQDPVTFDDFEKDKMRLFKINRARLKAGGHAYRP